MTPLSPGDIDAFTAASTIWRHDGDTLAADLRFPTFRDAVAFIVRAAFEAEAADHHPEIRNTYNRVFLRLTTHDAGNQVTARDLDLARRIEALAGGLTPLRPAPHPSAASPP